MNHFPLCPVCNVTPNPRPTSAGDKVRFECTNCGQFQLSGTAIAVLSNSEPSKRWKDRAKLSHWISLSHNPLIANDELHRLLRELPDISYREQSDNLILLLGDRFDSALKQPIVDSYLDLASIGAPTPNDLGALAFDLYSEKLIQHPGGWLSEAKPTRFQLMTVLTPQGWQKYEELKTSHSDAEVGFMALPFGDADAESMYRDVYRPAAESAGFQLRSLLDSHSPGLIDDKLKSELRRSSFIVAEITSCNCNVLWEAGFADGVGKPVVYSCRAEKWSTVKESTFDTNHMYTIIWSPDKKSEAAERLKGMLRDTFPQKARYE